MTSNFFTPLRYPGGKSGLGQWIAHLMRKNEISGGTYIEPYAGGAGVALYLLLNGYVNRVTINDVDPLIYAFWHSVINETEDFIKMIEGAPITVDTWLSQRDIANDKDQDKYSIIEKGFAAFFLNRTNRSGILKGGVIGGLDQTGKYKIDARFNKVDLIKRIEKIAYQSENIELTNLDALESIKRHSLNNNKRSLIYLDPPYYNKGSQLYRNFYTPKDHKKIAQAIMSLNTPWLVTYDNCDPIRELYTNVQSTEFSLVYSTSLERPKATEFMIYGNLKLARQPELTKSIRPYPKSWDCAA